MFDMFDTVVTSRSSASDVQRVVCSDRKMTLEAQITNEQPAATHLDRYLGKNVHVPFGYMWAPSCLSACVVEFSDA